MDKELFVLLVVIGVMVGACFIVPENRREDVGVDGKTNVVSAAINTNTLKNTSGR